MPSRDDKDWYRDHGELCTFARALEVDGMLEQAGETIYFFEKPWKWEREHERWVEAGRPDHFDFTGVARESLDLSLAGACECSEVEGE